MTRTAESSDPGPRAVDTGRLAVLLVLVLAPFIAFPPDFISKALLDGGDDLLANLPELIYSGKKLLQGEVLWMPELWMGHPLLAEPEFATFYFPKLMLLLGQPVVAYAAYLVLHYLAAEAGAYLYLKSLGIGRLGAVFGALAYAYAGFMLGHRAHTMYVCAGAWTPFVLLLFDRATERGGAARYLWAALVFAMVPFSGAIQLTVYLAGTIVLLNAARSWFERRVAPVASALANLVPALLVSSAQLLPSHDFARQLATDLRSDYALDVMHSFHPLLLPTLALPVSPLEGELYSRVGVVVLCAAGITLGNLRSIPPRIRAWAVVAFMAQLLMFGRYLPPLARLLHGLPVVGVLRGPVRHNFEFGLALSVLGAHGLEAARLRESRRIGGWLLGGVAFAAASFGIVRLAATGHVADVAAKNLIEGATPWTALAAALAFALWVFALGSGGASRTRFLWSAVALAPLFETAWAMRVEAWPNRSALGLLDVARGALPEASHRPVRLLSVSLLRGSADDLAGNSVLFHPGVESLQGYSSIAYSNAREVLDLDMHGQPRFYDELALSILPSVFGVSHVVLPSLACGDVRLLLAGSPGPCTRENALGNARPPVVNVAARQLDCVALTTGTTFRYRLEVTARAPSVDALGASFAFEGAPEWERRFAFEIPGSLLGPHPLRRSEPMRIADGESFGGLVLENHRGSPLEFWDTGLFVQRDVTVAALDGSMAAELTTERTEIAGGILHLEPKGSAALAETRVTLPSSARDPNGALVLEVEARSASSNPGDLVVDLHGDAGYDPDALELTIKGAELGPAWRVFASEIRTAGAPPDVRLRALSTGAGSVEVREVRLASRFDERVYEYPVAVHRYRPGVTLANGKLTLAAHAISGGVMHPPVRAFEMVLDAEAEAPLDGPVAFGLDAPMRFDQPRQWEVKGTLFATRARVHHVAVLPPDVRDPKLFVRVPGTKPLRVNEFSATDACTVRGYRNPRRLANGLFLYENPHAVARAYAVGDTVRARDPAAVRQALLEFDSSDLGKRAVVSDDVPSNLRPGIVEQATFGQARNDVVVNAIEGPTLLVVNERFDPDWHATIDGLKAAVVPVNGLVRGVVVPAGRHHVVLEYGAPLSVWLGLALALVGILVALFLLPALERTGVLGRAANAGPRDA